MRVLMAEENSLIAWGLEDLLQEAGYTVCGVASDAAQAIALAERERLDVVLMAIHLRQATDGIAAAQTIRTRLGIPCVLLGTAIDPAIRAQVLQAQPVAILDQPCDPKAVIAAIERCRQSRSCLSEPGSS